MEETSSNCVDCNVNTCPFDDETEEITGLWEHYMVWDFVWAQAGMKPKGGFLCIGCLEQRLGRRLTGLDFTFYPINEPAWFYSDRLLGRLMS